MKDSKPCPGTFQDLKYLSGMRSRVREGGEGGKREGGVDKAGAKRERREKGKNRQEGGT